MSPDLAPDPATADPAGVGRAASDPAAAERQPGILAGKVVVITGSTRGIGRAIAQACGREGARVVVCGRTDETIASTVNDLAAVHVPVCGLEADVASADDLEHLRDFALDTYGHIDCWVNNAGISLGYRPLDEIPPHDLRRIVDINVTGTVLGCRAILPYFREHGGVLLNMSGRGYRGEATPYTALYAATKTAVTSLTRSLAAENRTRPVSVHALVPGMVETDFYRDMDISPRLAKSADNWRHAMRAFGVPLSRVGTETARLLAQEPGRRTGRVYNLITPGQTARGVLSMIWLRATGQMPAEE